MKNLDLIIILTAILLVNSFAQQSKKDIVQTSIGRLEKVLFTSDNNYGYYNIFFSKLDKEVVKYPSEWKNPEIALIVGDTEFIKVYGIRYSDDKGNFRYYVDSDADSDFNDELPLEFIRYDNRQIADVQIRIQKISDEKSYQIFDYQIMFADKWIYSRISEFRYGEINIGEQIVKIMVRPSRGTPIYETSDRTEYFLDINQDGKINEAWKIDSTGNITASEKLSLSNPFLFNKQKLEVFQLKPDGTQITIKPTSKDTAYSIGFKIPYFSGKDKEGTIHTLDEFKGKKVLIELWSITCPHCEKIRPEVNSLIESYPHNNLISISIPREPNSDELINYLKDHQINSTLLFIEDSIKAKLNPIDAYPKFILLDENGVIRFQELGANYIRVIRRLLE